MCLRENMKKNEWKKEKKLMKQHIKLTRISKTMNFSHDAMVSIVALIVIKFPKSVNEFKLINDEVYVSEKGLDLIIDFFCKVTRVYELMDLALEFENDK